MLVRIEFILSIINKLLLQDIEELDPIISELLDRLKISKVDLKQICRRQGVSHITHCFLNEDDQQTLIDFGKMLDSRILDLNAFVSVMNFGVYEEWKDWILSMHDNFEEFIPKIARKSVELMRPEEESITE